MFFIIEWIITHVDVDVDNGCFVISISDRDPLLLVNVLSRPSVAVNLTSLGSGPLRVLLLLQVQFSTSWLFFHNSNIMIRYAFEQSTMC